jgi:hypothetical protein
MTYNNFASRISAPRVTQLPHLPVPAPATVKKPRKPTRHRISAAAALLLFPCLILGATTRAADIASFPDAAPAFISAQALPDAGSFGKMGLSPITEALLGIGVAVALIQARLLLSRAELEC